MIPHKEYQYHIEISRFHRVRGIYKFRKDYRLYFNISIFIESGYLKEVSGSLSTFSNICNF